MDKHDENTYKRGQVVWAALMHFTAGGWKSEIPSKFRTRVKRLLELDRKTDFSRTRGMQHAFTEETPAGTGTDYLFTPFDAFVLVIGLELLDAGFKQSEVVFLLRHLRETLRDEYEWILEAPNPARQRVFAKHQENRPKYTEKGHEWADFRVFAVIQKVELTELFAADKESHKAGVPVIFEPKFCRGINELRDTMHQIGHQTTFHKAMVIELSHAAYDVNEWLPKSPAMKRGRK